MIRVRQIKINVLKDNLDAVINMALKKAHINKDDLISYNINKKSIDARDKNDVLYVYEIDLNIQNEDMVKYGNDIVKIEQSNYSFKPQKKELESNPIIIGSGPCGLFTAYMLAEAGYNPIVFERGADVDTRVKDVEEFWKNNILKTNSNVQFGEGGAGTFSDGKLNTQIKDKSNRIKKVLEIFIKHGANPEIAYDYMPHIGTDKLREVVKSMREYIISKGGKFYFNSCLTNIFVKNNKIAEIEINSKDKYKTSILVLAIGHSARDTFYMLNDNDIKMENKPFAVGMRIMHNQSMINKNQYGKYAEYMPPASYKLIHNINGRGIYSFCMCPGGYVVNASSFENKLVVNGMSNLARESGIANSALIVTIGEKDYGTNLFDGIKYQEELEQKAYEIGNGLIPISKYIDYKNNSISSDFGDIKPTFKGKYNFANLNLLFSNEINNTIKDGIEYFGTKIKGFNNPDAVLAGVEARTSSPIRIIRDDNLESNIKGIYPAGEGAGYAGGITSAAVDGIKIYEKITE